MNVLKFIAGIILESTGLNFTISAFIKYPMSFKDMPEAIALVILLSILTLAFGIWMTGDSLKK